MTRQTHSDGLERLEAYWSRPHGLPAAAARQLADASELVAVERGACLSAQGSSDGFEYAIVSGKAALLVRDPEGREICLGLHAAPEALPPNMARSRAGIALADIQALTDLVVAALPATRLMDLMVRDPAIRDWGNRVMAGALSAKAGREWMLAALSGRERLAWLRRTCPDWEDNFPHHLIATYLGMTAVSLSRLRAVRRGPRDG